MVILVYQRVIGALQYVPCKVQLREYCSLALGHKIGPALDLLSADNEILPKVKSLRERVTECAKEESGLISCICR